MEMVPTGEAEEGSPYKISPRRETRDGMEKGEADGKKTSNPYEQWESKFALTQVPDSFQADNTRRSQAVIVGYLVLNDVVG